MSIQEQCRVVEHQQVSASHYRLTLQSAHISTTGQAGQFVNLRVSSETDPLLRRPLGIHRLNPEQLTFAVLYEVVGPGTELLSKYQPGQFIDVLGPLGKGFTIDPEKKIAIIVAGGMGAAPMVELGREIVESRKQNLEQRMIVLIGANTKQKILCGKEFKEFGAEVFVSTDDGSYGKRGLVSELLLELLEPLRSTLRAPLSTVYSCGPRPMLKAVSEIAHQKQISCQVSVEQKMACGFGTCMGCVIQTVNGYKRVCKDGPVFDSKEVVW